GSCLFGLVQLSMICLAGTLSRRDDLKDNAKVKKKTTNTGIIVSTVLTEAKTMDLEEVLQFCFYQTVQLPQIPLPGKPRGILPLVSAGVVLGLQCFLRTSILLMLMFRSSCVKGYMLPSR
uniref:Uncharacterized protein n=1 Tax=Aquila chrysaetos chrysaetos TaxID=223781 RepID=A0A663F8Y0_AQUCH